VKETILQMRGIIKEFFGVRVLDKVDFDIKKGEVHALIGENGAGKSTLMKILAGVYRKTEGEIRLKNEIGEMCDFDAKNPHEALQSGISMVFQEFNLMNNMSIAENIFLGSMPTKHGVLDKKTMCRKTQEQLEKVGLDVTPQTLVGSLSTAQKQCVEIAKCLSYDAKIIILDEPTASLSQKEVDTLFGLIRALKQKGVSIIYISHRIEEIFEIAERITVFRDGKLIDTVNTKDTNEKDLVNMIVGREFEIDENAEKYIHKNQIMLEVKGVSVSNFKGEINFKSYAGEILGVFGLIGSGRTELARTIFGIDPLKRGEIYKEGKPLHIKNPSDAIRNKIGLVSEDRKELGLITMHNVRDNMMLIKLRELPFVLWPKNSLEMEITDEYIRKLSIVTHGQTQLVESLSGGNQQKIAIAKWLSLNLDVLILDEPTRGVDIGAKAEIYSIMRQLAHAGMSIIMISSDMEEILRASNRVLIMQDGEVKLDAPTTELNQNIIMHAAIM